MLAALRVQQFVVTAAGVQVVARHQGSLRGGSSRCLSGADARRPVSDNMTTREGSIWGHRRKNDFGGNSSEALTNVGHGSEAERGPRMPIGGLSHEPRFASCRKHGMRFCPLAAQGL